MGLIGLIILLFIFNIILLRDIRRVLRANQDPDVFLRSFSFVYLKKIILTILMSALVSYLGKRGDYENFLICFVINMTLMPALITIGTSRCLERNNQ